MATNTAQFQRVERPARSATQAEHGPAFSWRVDLPVAIAIGLLAAMYTWLRVNVPSSFFRGDILTAYLPFFREIAERVKGWQLPGWNPSIFSGMPLAGDPTSNWGYLPAFVPFLFTGPLGAYKLYILVHMVLASVSTYLFGRVLRLSALGSAVAAIAMLLGPNYQYAQCCMVRMHLGSWLPVGLLAIELSLRSRQLWQRLLCWSLAGFVISQIIAGYFGKGIYLGVLFFGAYLAYRTLIERPGNEPISWRARFIELGISFAAIMGLALGFAGMSLLPRLDFLEDSNLRGGSYASVSARGAIEPPNWSIGQALHTILDPEQRTYYIGAAVFALAVVGVILARRRFAASFFALSSLAVWVLTLKPNAFHSLIYLIPRFKDLHEHDPQIILVLMTIGPAMLAGIAVTIVERRLASWRWTAGSAGGVAISLGVVAIAMRRDDFDLSSTMIRVPLGIAGLLAAVAVAAWLPSISHRQRQAAIRVIAAVITLVFFLNLDRGRIATTDFDSWRSRPAGAAAVSYADPENAGGGAAFLRERMQAEGPFRYFGYNSEFLSLKSNAMRDNYRSAWRDILASELLLNNRAIPLGLQDIQGYDPVQEMNYLAFINALNGQEQEYHETNVLPNGLSSPMLRLLNVHYVVIPLDASGDDFDQLIAAYPEVYRDDSVRVLEIPNALPRAWTVHDVNQVSSDDLLPTLAAGSIDPGTTALVTETPPVLSASPAENGDTVVIRSYEPERISLSAEMGSDGMVVLSEVYDPGWSATVDGEKAELYEVDGVLRGVVVPAGAHEIVMTYSVSPLRDGIALTVATLLFTLIAAFLLWRMPEDRRRRRFWSRIERIVIPDSFIEASRKSGEG